MKTGDEVYIKSEGAEAVRRRIHDIDKNGDHWLTGGWVRVKQDDIAPLTPTDRLWSELLQIAKMTGCWVAVDPKSNEIIISKNEMVLDKEWVPTEDWHFIDGVLTCPNCPDHRLQINPRGEIV